jgi:crotonobetainyl-CoA:carnitine CoA-transferase CaiB-like acyl-CoA transferase
MLLPLDGIRVLDLSYRMPGPVCAQILADLGAEVIKVESPRAPDFFRRFEPRVNGSGSLFHVCNRNKKGLTLELRHPRGREIFLQLIKNSDVVVEAFRPGTMERMKIGYDVLKEANPALILCSLTAFGQTGPYRMRPAHDLNLLALSGVLDLLGNKDGPPIVPPVQISGLGGAFQGVVGILAALLSRGKTGRGQSIDVSLLDGVSAFAALEMSRYMAGHHIPKRGLTEGGGGYACFNVYRTADGRYLSLGCLEPQFWETFCRLIGRESLIAEQWSAPPRQDELIAEVRSILLSRTLDEWLGILDPGTICVAPVNTFEEALQDSHIREQETWFEGELPRGGKVPQAALPIRFDGDRPGWRSHPPEHGEHTREILRGLGLADGDIEDLRALDVI